MADPNFTPMYGHRSRRIKTDRRDVAALADACQQGCYRAAHRRSAAQRTVQIAAEHSSRTDGRSDAGHLARPGHHPRRGLSRFGVAAPHTFLTRVAELDLPPSMTETLSPFDVDRSPGRGAHQGG